jgi:hypothetical protein
MDEHRSLIGALGVGIFLAGLAGLLAYAVQEKIAHPARPLPITASVSILCLIVAAAGLVVLGSVLARVHVIRCHGRKLAAWTDEGSELFRRARRMEDDQRLLRELKVGDPAFDLHSEIDEWTIEVRTWLNQKLPILAPHFDSDSGILEIELLAGLTAVRECRTELDVRLSRLREITWKL